MSRRKMEACRPSSTRRHRTGWAAWQLALQALVHVPMASPHRLIARRRLHSEAGESLGCKPSLRTLVALVPTQNRPCAMQRCCGVDWYARSAIDTSCSLPLLRTL